MKFWRATFWTAAGTLFILVFLLLVSVIFYYILLVPPVQQRVLRFAEAQMGAFMAGDIKIERVESDLLRRIDLYGIRAKGTDKYGDSIYVKHASIRYSLPALIRKTVKVRSVIVQDVYAQVVWADKWIRLPVLPADLKPGGGPSVSTDTLILDSLDWKVDLGTAKAFNVNAVYRDTDLKMVGEIRHAEAEAKFHRLDSFSVKLAVPSARYESPWWQGEIDTIGGTGAITWKGMDLHTFQVIGSGTQVKGKGHIAFSAEDDWILTADVRTDLEPLPIIYRSVEGLSSSGHLQGTASWKGSLKRPVLSASFTGSGFNYNGFEISRISVGATYDEDDLVRTKIDGSTHIGGFDVSSSVQVDSLTWRPKFGHYSISAHLNQVGVKSVVDQFRLPFRIPGQVVNARLSADGFGIEQMPSVIKATVTVNGAEFARHPLVMDASLRKNKWSITGDWGINRAEGSGTIKLSNMDVNGYLAMDLPLPSMISTSFFKENVTGRIMSHLDIQGDIANPQIKALAKGERIHWRGIHADTIDAFLTVENKVFSLTRADAVMKGNIDSVALFMGLDSMSGQVEVDVSMTGSLLKPFMHASVRGQNLKYGQTGLGSASGILIMEKDTVRWADFRFGQKNINILSHGRVLLGPVLSTELNADFTAADRGSKLGSVYLSASMGDSLKGEYRVSGVDLRAFEPWVPSGFEMGGSMYLLGQIWGTSANPVTKLEFQLTEPSFKKYRASDFSGTVKYSDSLITFSGNLKVSNAISTLQMNAMVPVKPSAGYKLDESGDRIALLRAVADTFDLQGLAQFMGGDIQARGPAHFEAELRNSGSGWEVGGSAMLKNAELTYVPQSIRTTGINCLANVSGTLDRPDGSFVLTTGPVSMPRVRLEKTSVRGRTSLDTLFLDEVKLDLKDSAQVRIQARAPYKAMDSLLQKDGLEAKFDLVRVPAALVSPFLPQYGVRKGLLNAKGQASIKHGVPNVNGNAVLMGLEFSIPDIQPSVGPVNAEINFSGNTILVPTAKVKWGNGLIQASGRASWTLEKLQDLNLRIRADKLSFELPEVVQVGIDNAALQVTDLEDRFVVNGRVNLGPTRYLRDVRITDMVNQLQIGQEVRRRGPDPFLQSVLLRIDVDLAENLNVNMNLGNARLDGRLAVGGTLGEPGFTGELKAIDGYVLYLDRKFTISEANIYNPDPFVINPNLNIKAYTPVTVTSPLAKTEEFVIHLNVTGTLENPMVSFTSEPEDLSDLDIFSVLTLGQRLGSIGSDLNDRLKSFAAQQLAGFGARKLEQLGIFDRIDISDLFNSNSDQGSRVSVTKRISNRLVLSYETLVGKLSERKVTAHYRLTPHIYLEGQTNGETESGLDLIFRYSK